MIRKDIFLSILLSFAILFSVPIFGEKIHAWFGAGKTPGWSPTTTGLSGEIPLQSYKFAPDFYRVGDAVNPIVTGFNPSGSSVTSQYYLAIDRVIESPKGMNVTDGTPNTPGINENDLNTNHQNNNDIQNQATLINLGKIVFPANGNTTFSASYTTTETGYFQFDFIDIDPANYVPGHILAAGYFRVLPALLTPTPSVSPTPSATSNPSDIPTTTPAPTPTSTPNPKAGSQSQMGIDGQICEGNNFDVWAIVTQDGNPVQGVNVKFVYHNEAKYAKTEVNGRAGVAYGYVDDEDVQAIPDGYPSQSQHITKDLKCRTVVIDSGKTSSGQVLGITSMARTGTTEEIFTDAIGSIGATLTSVGTILSLKKKLI